MPPPVSSRSSLASLSPWMVTRLSLCWNQKPQSHSPLSSSHLLPPSTAGSLVVPLPNNSPAPIKALVKSPQHHQSSLTLQSASLYPHSHAKPHRSDDLLFCSECPNLFCKSFRGVSLLVSHPSVLGTHQACSNLRTFALTVWNFLPTDWPLHSPQAFISSSIFEQDSLWPLCLKALPSLLSLVFLYLWFIFRYQVSSSTGWLWTHCVVRNDLELLTLPPPPECWGFRPRDSSLLGKHSNNWAMFPGK